MKLKNKLSVVNLLGCCCLCFHSAL